MATHGTALASGVPSASFRVPDMSPLLTYGTVPSLENFDFFLGELDRLLEENSRKLDTTVTDILRITNELPNMTRFGSPTESLDHMLSSRALDHAGCNPRPSDVCQFLKKILKLLEKYQGCEDSLLQSVLKMAAAEGLTLPLKASSGPETGGLLSQVPPDDSSFTSESTFQSTKHSYAKEQMTCDGLWNEVSSRFRRFYVDRLQLGMLQQPTGFKSLGLRSTPEIIVYDDLRLHSLQSLSALYPTHDVWTKYCSIRRQHLRRVISDQLFVDHTNTPSPPTALAQQNSSSSNSSGQNVQNNPNACSNRKSSRILARFESGDSGDSNAASVTIIGSAPLVAGGSTDRGPTFPDLVGLGQQFEETLSTLCGLAHEDVQMISSSGIFRSVLPDFAAVDALYFEAVCDCVKEVVDKIVSTREKVAVEHKDLLKSRSDWGILVSLRNSLRRGYGDHSRSMDSLVMAFVTAGRQNGEVAATLSGADCDADEATPLAQSFVNGNDPTKASDPLPPIDASLSHLLLGPVLRIVSSLLAFEAHLDRLFLESVGEFQTGTPGRTGPATLGLARGANTKPKGVLKPVQSRANLGSETRMEEDDEDDDDDDIESALDRLEHPDDASTPLGDSTLNTTTTSNGNLLYDFSNSTVEADSSLEDYFQLNVLPTLKVKSQKGTIGQKSFSATTGCKNLPGGATIVRNSLMDVRPVLEWRPVFSRLVPDLTWSVEHLLKEGFLQMLDLEEEAYEDACAGSGGASSTFQMSRVCADFLGLSASAVGAAPVADGENDQIFEKSFSSEAMDYPKNVSQNIAAVIEIADRLLPLAQAGIEGSVFQAIRSSFADALSANVSRLVLWLRALVKDWPEKCPTRCVLQIYGSAAVIRNHLFHYDSVLSSSSSSQQKLTFATTVKTVSDFLRDLEDYLIQGLTNQITTCVLMDVEGQNWQDTKAFFEGDRCSYAMQMWLIYLRALSTDLWNFCPAPFARRVLAYVLDSSVSTIAQRYARVQPSFQRLSQFRKDLTVVLATLTEFLSYVSPTSTAYLSPMYSHHCNHLSAIHDRASVILAELVVVSCPLVDIYKVFKRGFRRNAGSKSTLNKMGTSVATNSQQEQCKFNKCKAHQVQWIALLRPELLSPVSTNLSASPEFAIRCYGDLQTASAVNLHLKLLAAQPSPSWPMVVHALILKDYTLTIMLLTQPELGVESPSLQSHSKIVDPKKKIQSGCGGVFCCGELYSSDSLMSMETLCSATTPFVRSMDSNPCHSFFHVLNQHSPHDLEVFAKVLIPVINNSNTWYVFDAKAIPGRSFTIPNWLDALYYLLRPLVTAIVAPSLRAVLNGQSSSALTMNSRGKQGVVGGVPLPSDVDMATLCSTLTDLPCGCKPAFHETAKAKHNLPQQKTSADNLIQRCLQLLADIVANVSLLLPAPLAVFCLTAQKELSKQRQNAFNNGNRQLGSSLPNPSHGSVGLQLLASAVFKHLCDSTYLEQVTNVEIRPVSRDLLRVVADAFFHSLTADHEAVSSSASTAEVVSKQKNIPKSTAVFLKANWDWFPSRIETVISNVEQIASAPVFDLDPPSIFPVASLELFDEAFCEALAFQIRESGQGRFALRQVFNLLYSNRSWVSSKLDGTPLMSSCPLFHVPRDTVPSIDVSTTLDYFLEAPDFNPYRDFDVLPGSSVGVNDEQVFNYSFDFPKLLHSNLGLTETGFRHLLHNRPDMQDGAVLSENEKKQVSVLKATLEMEPSEAI